MERERATRWGLGAEQSAARSSRPATAAPDIVMDYEQALRPELTLYTDVQGLQGALEEVLTLAHRLQRVASVPHAPIALRFNSLIPNSVGPGTRPAVSSGRRQRGSHRSAPGGKGDTQ